MRLSVPRILAIVFCFVALLPSLIADELVSDRDPTKIQKEITNSIGMKLRRSPAGTFLMGSPESEKGRGKDEGPQHPVKISKPFYMGVYEVTQAEHEKVMGRNPSYFRRDGRGGQKVQGMDTSSFPVETVSWDDAVAFCKKLSEMPAEKKAGRV